ncbi:sulfurtransferase [candidate division KSB1 bacterium]|nr:MAG: sulfurtransferase [candidate division KSB1 bacterium]
MSLLISTEWLADHLHDPQLVIAHVGWEAESPHAARELYQRGHIPGALFFNLDTDLSDRSDLSLGRHPLPDPQRFVSVLASKGIGPRTKLVIYDDKAGSIALRLWWMMRWIGAPEAILLDGGFGKWRVENRPVELGSGRIPEPATEPLIPRVNSAMIASTNEVESIAQNGIILLDARAPERFHGEIEPIDIRAGHIPGAVNAPWAENLSDPATGTFKTPAELRARFESLDLTPQSQIVCSCGSGVTACHDIFALELAGFQGSRLYPGSWSEWIAKHPA